MRIPLTVLPLLAAAALGPGIAAGARPGTSPAGGGDGALCAAPAGGAPVAQEAWKRDTALVSREGEKTAVRRYGEVGVVYEAADPKKAIEWALRNATTAVVLAGDYKISDSVIVPRDGVTLIIAEGARISLDPETEHKTDIGFRSRRHPGYWTMVPLVYVRGRNHVRVVHLGTLVHSVWEGEKHGKQTFPIVFDGRNEKRTCGLEGGTLIVAGAVGQSCLLLDARGVEVPLIAHNPGLDAILVLEGCEDIKLGTIINLAAQPGGQTGETVDLNSRNRGIRIDRLIGERPYEIIDCNESQAAVGEIVSVGPPRKLFTKTTGSGPRWTSRSSTGTVSLEIAKTTILEDAVKVDLRREVPDLPGALPRFSVKARVTIERKDGTEKVYEAEAEVDVRSGRKAKRPVIGS